MGVITPDALEGWAALGELGLDGRIAAVGGTLSAAMAANAMGLGLICPEANGPEAAWAGDVSILAPRSLIGLVNHFKGTQVLRAPERGPVLAGARSPTCARSRVRRAPSARWRSPPPGATTCCSSARPGRASR
jgi:magnesium chelatase family protein